MLRLARRLISTRAPQSPPRAFPTSGFQLIPNSVKFEEETDLPLSDYYNVRLGQLFEERYQAVSKLGWGTSATVWLCRDLVDHKYVALKVYVRGHPSAARERMAMEKLKSAKEVSSIVQNFQAHFTAQNAQSQSNECFVLEALGRSLADMRPLLPKGHWPLGYFRAMTYNILQSVHFLHKHANLIHCDIRQENFLMCTEDDTIFRLMEKRELSEPSPRKYVGDQVVHTSTSYDLPDGRWGLTSLAVLCDFGEARDGSEGLIAERIQPFEYRAPEILLVIPWSYPVDVWNLGVMLWEMFEGEILFDPRDKNDKINDYVHLMQLVSVLGNPSPEFLRRSVSHDVIVSPRGYFNEDGSLESWKAFPESNSLPLFTLEDRERRLEGEEKADFLRFIRRFLEWEPEKRATVEELLQDPFLDMELWKLE